MDLNICVIKHLFDITQNNYTKYKCVSTKDHKSMMNFIIKTLILHYYKVHFFKSAKKQSQSVHSLNHSSGKIILCELCYYKCTFNTRDLFIQVQIISKGLSLSMQVERVNDDSIFRFVWTNHLITHFMNTWQSLDRGSRWVCIRRVTCVWDAL